MCVRLQEDNLTTAEEKTQYIDGTLGYMRRAIYCLFLINII